ncbi:hypothetical protein F5878DRAFT_309581 [Lentinula raphanica]|uniref:Uncharacterized protein n=1 Tax=Lentinula raphanica TaxID=153919 RepID=A0AA38UA73_9AGAR|nr:hypothetical protein F5878DRAFT_309581 [Lentinula raphanica]
MATSTSSIFPSSSSSSFADDSGSNSHRLAAAGAVLGVLGIIGIGLIIWWTVKMKPKVPYEEEAPATPVPPQMHANESSGSSPGIADALRRSLTLNGGGLGRSKSDLSQSKSLAAKITPFNPDSTTDGDGPRFVHTPGANMRIATRLSNGVWQFSEPVRGALGQIHPLAAASQASLLQTQNIERSLSPIPHSPYLTPTSNPANPFSDAHVYAPTRCESPIENPFQSEEGHERDQFRQGTVDSHVSTTTTTPKYPFTRPNALTLRTQTQSVIRGTVYDLQSLSSAGTSVPAGIHDLDEDVVKNRGKPLPVADSELMRRGMRRENSIGAAGLLGLSSSTSLLSRQDSADSHYAEPVHGRRPSVSSAVLLGGTGPVGPSRNLSTNSGNRTTTYHPDLDEVVDVRGETDDVEDDLADVREEDLQGAFVSLSGHELPSSTSNHNDFPRSISHASQPSVSTIATSSYPHTVITKGGSSYGLGLAHPQASTSTVYVGSLGHLMRPSVDGERPGETSTNSRPNLSIEPTMVKKGKRLSRNSTLATTYEGFEGENTLVYEPPISPGTSYPYSPTSTSYTHDIQTRGKSWKRQSSALGSESHGYGHGLGYGYGYPQLSSDLHHAQLGLDDIYAVDSSMSIAGYDDTREDDDGGDTTIHGIPPPKVGERVDEVEIMDVPGMPPPAYLSPRKSERSSSRSRSRGRSDLD